MYGSEKVNINAYSISMASDQYKSRVGRNIYITSSSCE